jgi:hypothetical protein
MLMFTRGWNSGILEYLMGYNPMIIWTVMLMDGFLKVHHHQSLINGDSMMIDWLLNGA